MPHFGRRLPRRTPERAAALWLQSLVRHRGELSSTAARGEPRSASLQARGRCAQDLRCLRTLVWRWRNTVSFSIAYQRQLRLPIRHKALRPVPARSSLRLPGGRVGSRICDRVLRQNAEKRILLRAIAIPVNLCRISQILREFSRFWRGSGLSENPFVGGSIPPLTTCNSSLRSPTDVGGNQGLLETSHS